VGGDCGIFVGVEEVILDVGVLGVIGVELLAVVVISDCSAVEVELGSNQTIVGVFRGVELWRSVATAM